MVQRYFPFDAGAGAQVLEGEWQKMAGSWMTSGYVKGNSAELVAVTPSGLLIRLNGGAAWLRGYWYDTDANIDLAAGAAHATLPRIDTLVLRLDRTANTITPVIVAGIAAAAPVPPALNATDTLFDLPIADARINAAATVIASVTDRRWRAVPTHGAGGQVAYAEALFDQGAITAEVDLTSLSVLLNSPGGRRYKITGDIMAASTVTTDHVTLYVKEGATNLTQRSIPISRAGVGHMLAAGVTLTPGAGAHTYRLALARPLGGGVVTMTAAASAVAFIKVEDIGPA